MGSTDHCARFDDSCHARMSSLQTLDVSEMAAISFIEEMYLIYMISCCYHTVECQRNRNRVDVGMTKAMTENVVRLNCGDRLSDTNCGVGLVRAPTTGKYCTERRICYIFPPCSIRGVVGLLEGSLLFLNRIPIQIQPLFTPSKKPPRYT